MKDAIKKVTNAEIAKNIMTILKNRTIDDCIDQLKAFTKNFESDVKEVDDKFLDKWKTLREERNNIIHSNSIYVHWNRTDEVFKLTKKSVEVFSKVKNKLL